MLTAKEIKDTSEYILKKQAELEQKSSQMVKDQISSAIEEDSFIRNDMMFLHNILTSYINEYKFISGFTKDNYTKVSTLYPYKGENYSETAVDDLQEVIDGAFLYDTNSNDLPVGNLFYHSTIDWFDKNSEVSVPNETPDIRNNFPVGATKYKYDGYNKETESYSWWVDSTSKLYKPYYYQNELDIIYRLQKAITVYNNGLIDLDAIDVTLSSYEPTIRYLDETIPPLVIDENGDIVDINSAYTLFQETGEGCLYENHQLGLARDNNGTGTNYFLIELIEKDPPTNNSAPYYFMYKEIGRSGNDPVGNLVINFNLTNNSTIIQQIIDNIVSTWESVLIKNNNAMAENPYSTEDDDEAKENTEDTIDSINSWQNNILRFSIISLNAFNIMISTRNAFITNRLITIVNYINSTTFFSDRKNLIYLRINKKSGGLSNISGLCKSGYSSIQIEENVTNYLEFLKRKMVVKKFKEDGTGWLNIKCPIGLDEETYYLNVGDEVYLLSDISSYNFINDVLGKATILGISYAFVDEVNDTGETGKVKVKVYKLNKVISKKLKVLDNARLVCILPPYNE